MNVKEYLGQIKKLEKMISNKTDEIEKLRKIKGAFLLESENGHRVAALESEALQYVNDLLVKQGEISKTIEKLESHVEYDLLYKVYIQGKTLQEVADIYGRTYSWSTTIHHMAKKSLQKILDDGCN